MDFETAFARYQAGTADAEETALVEQELEKHRLIEDYLAAQELPELPREDAAQATAEAKAVKRTINRRTRSTVLITMAAVLAVVLLLQFVAAPLINRTVYDDTWRGAGCDGADYRDFDVAMSVLAGLYMPLGDYSGSYSRHTGFMTDTIDLQFNRFYTDNSSTLIRTDIPLFLGILGELDPNEIRSMYYATSGHFSTYLNADGTPAEPTGHSQKALAEMGDQFTVTSSVNFTEDMTPDELAALMDRYPDVDFISANTAYIYGNYTYDMLFCSLHRMACGYGAKLEEAYPGLQFSEASYPGFSGHKSVTGAQIQQHFEAMLQFLVDHPRLTRPAKLMNPSDRYAWMLESIRQDGLRFAGVWVQGIPSDLLELAEDDTVRSLSNYHAEIRLWNDD